MLFELPLKLPISLLSHRALFCFDTDFGRGWNKSDSPGRTFWLVATLGCRQNRFEMIWWVKDFFLFPISENDANKKQIQYESLDTAEKNGVK